MDSSSSHDLVELILQIGLHLSFSKAVPRSTKSEGLIKGWDEFSPGLSLAESFVVSSRIQSRNTLQALVRLLFLEKARRLVAIQQLQMSLERLKAHSTAC